MRCVGGACFSQTDRSLQRDKSRLTDSLTLKIHLYEEAVLGRKKRVSRLVQLKMNKKTMKQSNTKAKKEKEKKVKSE